MITSRGHAHRSMSAQAGSVACCERGHVPALIAGTRGRIASDRRCRSLAPETTASLDGAAWLRGCREPLCDTDV